MYESIGVQLKLIASFRQVAKESAADLRLITAGLNEIKEAGKRFDLSGLSELQSKLTGVAAGAKTAAEEVRALNTILTSTNTRANSAAENLGRVAVNIAEVGSRAVGATTSVEGFAVSTGKAGRASQAAGEASKSHALALRDIQAEAGKAAEAVLRLSTSATGLGRVRVDALGRAFLGIASDADRAVLSINAARFAAEALNRTVALPAAPFQRALPPGTYPRGATIYSGVGQTVGSPPVERTRGGMYGGPPPPPYRGSTAITPYEEFPLGNGAYYAGPNGSGGNGGNIPPNPFGQGPPEERGPSWGDRSAAFGKKTMRFGNDMQSAGFAGVVNAAMVGGIVIPIVKSLVDLQDLVRITNESLAHAGATPANAEKFTNRMRNMFVQEGGDYRENVVGLYPFVSSAPIKQAGLNINKEKDQKVMEEIYRLAVKLHIADNSSATPDSMYSMVLGLAATAHNLGYKMDTPDHVEKAYTDAANILVQGKNKTGSTAQQMAMAFRQFGPLAANIGIPADEMAGIMMILADSKLLGGMAGNQFKRITQRQGTDPKALAKLQAKVAEATHGEYHLDMFDPKTGALKGVYSLIGEIVEVQKKFMNPRDAKGRAAMDTIIAGLYATPALSSLIQFAYDGKDHMKPGETTAQWMKRFGDGLVHDKPAGARKGETPLDTTVRLRQEQNVKQAALKTSGHFLNEGLKTLDRETPNILALLKGINDLITAWGKLPAPIQDAAIKGAAFMVIGGGIIGITGILIGNFIKLGGAVILVGSNLVKATEFLTGVRILGPVGAMFTTTFAGIIPRAIGAATLALTGFAPGVMALAAAPLLIPIGIIAGAIGLIALAWHRDWFNIRENTAAEIALIIACFKGVKSGLDSITSTFDKWDKDSHASVKSGLDSITSAFDKFDVDSHASVKSWAQNIIQTLDKWDKDSHDLVRQWGENVKKDMEGWATWALTSGEKFASQFTDGVVKTFTAGKDKIKQGLQFIGDLFPHSPPKDPLSPLNVSGAAFGNFLLDSYLLHMETTGKTKAKKALKPIADTFIELRGQTVAEVTKMANEIEGALKASGGVIKDRWITLFDPTTHTATRVHGDPAAFRAANTRNPKDQSANEARDYWRQELDRMKAHPDLVWPGDLEQVVENLRKFEQGASAKSVLAIEHLVATITSAGKVAQKKMSAEFTKLSNGFTAQEGHIDTGFSQEATYQSRFSTISGRADEKLANWIKMRKDAENPSKSDLHRELSTEISERNELTGILEKEQNLRVKLQAAYEKLNSAALAMKPQTEAEVKLRQQTLDKAKEYKDQIDQLDVTMQGHAAVILDVTKKIDDYGTKLDSTKVKLTGFAAVMDTAWKKAAKSAADALGTGVGNEVDSFMSRFLGDRTKKGSIIQTAIGDFVKTFVKSLVSQVMDEMLKNLEGGMGSFFQNLLGKVFGGGGSSGGGGGFGAAGNILGKVVPGIAGTGASASAFSGSNSALPTNVVLRSETGSTDIGSVIASSSTTTADAVSNSPFGGVGANPPPIDTSSLDKLPTLNADVGKKTASFAQKAAGALMFIQGAVDTGQNGGSLNNGFQMGLGAFEATGNPYVAGAAFLWGTFGGPHWGPASNYPDRGPGAAQYQSWLSSYNNGSSNDGGFQIENFLKTLTPQAIAGLTPDQQKEINDIKALNPGMIPGGFGISNEHDGVFKFGGGGSMSVQQFQTESADVLALASQSMNSLLQQQANADRLAASFTTMMLNGPAGFVMPAFLGGHESGRGGPPTLHLPVNRNDAKLFQNLLSGNSATAGQNPGTGPITIKVLEGASVADGTDVLNKIEEAIPMIVNAVWRDSYNRGRLVGNYQSQTT